MPPMVWLMEFNSKADAKLNSSLFLPGEAHTFREVCGTSAGQISFWILVSATIAVSLMSSSFVVLGHVWVLLFISLLRVEPFKRVLFPVPSTGALLGSSLISLSVFGPVRPFCLASPEIPALAWSFLSIIVVVAILGLNWSLPRLSSLTTESFEFISTLTGEDLPLVLISPKADEPLWPWHFFLVEPILGLNWSLL